MSPLNAPSSRLDSAAAAKRALRREMIARRADLARDAPGAAQALADQFPIADLPPGLKVSAYAPMGSEIDPSPLLGRLAARGAMILLPVVTARGGALTFREAGEPALYVPDDVGLPGPPPDARAAAPDLILAPLLAFDLLGGRLGYGGGYYDRTIAALRAGPGVRVVGLAYEGQAVGAVPRDAHDQVLDAIATEIGYRSLIFQES
jgi:5-formyltetrahydrofolate cyclo-ligase